MFLARGVVLALGESGEERQAIKFPASSARFSSEHTCPPIPCRVSYVRCLMACRRLMLMSDPRAQS